LLQFIHTDQERKLMKPVMALALSLTLCVFAAQAQQSTATAPAKTTRKKMAPKTDPAIAAQLNELKQAVDAQQQQIRQLSGQVQSRDQQIQQLQKRLDQSQGCNSPGRVEGGHGSFSDCRASADGNFA
jgi:TolA-binding protein